MSRGFRVVAMSNVGMIRTENEDSGLASSRVLAVADGMGGHAAGEVASASVIQAIDSELENLPLTIPQALDWLRECVNFAHASVGDLIADDPDKRGMGTTLSAVVACDDGVIFAHVGDSRVYQLRHDNLTQITTDHTYVQLLVQQGQLTPDEATHHPRKNLLMRAVDGIHEVELDSGSIGVELGDRFLVCSDGLSGVMSDEFIAQVLQSPDLTYAASTLLECALAAGAPDNVTILIGQYEENPVDIAPFLVGAALQQAPTQKSKLANFPIKRWLWGLGILIGVLAISALGAKWLGAQWFLGSANGHLAIYRGIDQDLGPISFSHMYTETDYPVATLTLSDQQDLLDGIRVDNLIDAQYTIQVLLSRSSICAQSTLGCLAS